MIIYKATNVVNRKVYIGQTTNSLEYRKQQHFRDVKRKGRRKTYFINALSKYGIDNFKFEIIDKANSIKELNNKEIKWIKYYDSTNREKGYNLDSGGNNGKKTEYTKNIIGKHTKLLWKDNKLKNQMLKGLKKGTKQHIKNCYNKREPVVCKYCRKIIFLPHHQAKNRKFCSNKCAYNFRNGDLLKYANKSQKEMKLNRDQQINQIVKEWAKKNKCCINHTPLNKITKYLQPLIDTVYSQCNIKDLRTISKACCGSINKKDFIKFLQNIQ